MRYFIQKGNAIVLNPQDVKCRHRLNRWNLEAPCVTSVISIGDLKMYQGIFIDDQDKHFASLMSTPGKNGLFVKFQQPTELINLANHIVESPPAFVALNYHQKMPKNAYKAELLAQLLRSHTSFGVRDKSIFDGMSLCHYNTFFVLNYF